MAGVGTSTRSRLAAPLIAAALLAVSCSSSEYRYVANQPTNTYPKVPKAWKGFDANLLDRAEARAVEVAGEQAPSFVDLLFNGSLQWRVAFDSDPNPQPAHAVSFAVDPVVEVRVRNLTPDERDHVNLASLRNMFFPYDQLKAQAEEERKGRPLEANPPATSAFRPLEEIPISTAEGVRGNRLVFEVRRGNQFYVVDQTVLLDAKAERVHALLIRAAEREYLANGALLDDVATSFTVKPKD